LIGILIHCYAFANYEYVEYRTFDIATDVIPFKPEACEADC
jgi:hypothetical protein